MCGSQTNRRNRLLRVSHPRYLKATKLQFLGDTVHREESRASPETGVIETHLPESSPQVIKILTSL